MGNEQNGGAADSSPRVVMYGRKAQEIRIHNPRAVAAQLGGSVLAAFYKCFNGADRICALQHLMHLVHAAEEIEGADGDEAAGYMRDIWVVGMLLAGAMREVAIALNELHGTRVTRDEALRDAWAPLDEIRRQFEDEYARNMRNNFSMHLGELQHYVDGIAAGTDETAVLLVTSGRRHGGAFIEPWDALLRAHQLKHDDYDAFVERTKKAHHALPKLLINLFRDVLVLRGVPIEFRPGRRLAEPAADDHG